MLAKLHIRGNLTCKITNLGPTWDHLGANLSPKWSQEGPRWSQGGPSWSQVGPSWANLGQLGAKLGAKLGPSWQQNRKKWGTKTMSKKLSKSGAAVVRGGPQWYATRRSPGPYRIPSGSSNPLIPAPPGVQGLFNALGTLHFVP